MSVGTKWTTSIDELVVLFRDAMCALVPIAERAHMPWREPNAYDDWDRICEAIYRSIVIGSIECADELGTFLPVPNYDHRNTSYEKNSFIGDEKSKESEAFVCFETETRPFDRCLFAVFDRSLNVAGSRRVATKDVRFVFCGRNGDGGVVEFFDKLTVSL